MPDPKQVVLDRGVSWDQALAKRAEAAEAGMDQVYKDGNNLVKGVSSTCTAACQNWL